MAGMRAVGALKSLMLVSRLAKAQWGDDAEMHEMLKLVHSADELLSDLCEVEASAIHFAKWAPWLIPCLQPRTLSEFAALSEALPYYAGGIAALSGGGAWAKRRHWAIMQWQVQCPLHWGDFISRL